MAKKTTTREPDEFETSQVDLVAANFQQRHGTPMRDIVQVVGAPGIITIPRNQLDKYLSVGFKLYVKGEPDADLEVDEEESEVEPEKEPDWDGFTVPQLRDVLATEGISHKASAKRSELIGLLNKSEVDPADYSEDEETGEDEGEDPELEE